MKNFEFIITLFIILLKYLLDIKLKLYLIKLNYYQNKYFNKKFVVLINCQNLTK